MFSTRKGTFTDRNRAEQSLEGQSPPQNISETACLCLPRELPAGLAPACSVPFALEQTNACRRLAVLWEPLLPGPNGVAATAPGARHGRWPLITAQGHADPQAPALSLPARALWAAQGGQRRPRPDGQDSDRLHPGARGRRQALPPERESASPHPMPPSQARGPCPGTLSCRAPASLPGSEEPSQVTCSPGTARGWSAAPALCPFSAHGKPTSVHSSSGTMWGAGWHPSEYGVLLLEEGESAETTHKFMHTHSNTQHTHSCTHIHSHTHVSTHTLTFTHMHSHTHIQYSCLYSHSHTICTLIYAHAFTHTQNTHTQHTFIYIHNTHIYTDAHIQYIPPFIYLILT